jgi:hypothetical protein
MLGEIMNQEDLVFRLRKRAEIRRQISSRKSVQQGQPDRISDILEEAANEIDSLRKKLLHVYDSIYDDGK